MKYTEKDWTEMAENGKVQMLTEIKRRLESKQFILKDDAKKENERKIQLLENLIDKAETILDEYVKEDRKKYKEAEPRINEVKEKLKEFATQLEKDYPNLVGKVVVSSMANTEAGLTIHFNYR